MADNGSKTAPATKADPAPWTVRDTNCKLDETRTHEIVVDGAIKAYKFTYHADVPMPEGHAKKYMHDDAFVVLRPDGQRVKAAISITRGFDANKLVLAADECVARLEELSMESLLDRAAPMAGGETLSLRSGKKAVIEFLIQARKKKITQNLSPEKREAGGDVEDMSEAELKRIAELEAA